jgi:hypothetical protein
LADFLKTQRDNEAAILTFLLAPAAGLSRRPPRLKIRHRLVSTRRVAQFKN